MTRMRVRQALVALALLAALALPGKLALGSAALSIHPYGPCTAAAIPC